MIGQVTCMIAPSMEIFDKTELENPSQVESMLRYLYSITDELPFGVIIDDGEGNVTNRFGKQEK